MASFWRRLRGALSGLSATTSEVEAKGFAVKTLRPGGTPIAEVKDREPTVVYGEVRSVALRPQVQVPALVVEIADGTRPMHVVWLGRRHIAGIEPGVLLRVSGRATLQRGIATIFNPSYDIIPRHG